MEINYWGTGLFILLMIGLVVWLVRRNRKDEKAFEKELIQSELKPEADKDHDEPSPDNI
jgi:cbb3-type cytochrome oxidase subunit 3